MRVVLWGAGLLLVSIVAVAAATIGYRLGVMALSVALLALLAGFVLAIGAAVLSLVGLVITLRRPKETRRGLALTVTTLVVATTLIAVPAQFSLGGLAPPIHDITTDTEDPPEFVAVVPLRSDAPNPVQYGGEPIAAQQREAYPDLEPLTVNVPPAEAFDHALATANDMGWDLVGADPIAGRIEATDTTFWLGFKDDVVIRVRPASGGSRIDVRSLSRVGVGDVGTNARRIRAYLDALAQRVRATS